jgi:hypothetical protein
LSQKEVKAGRKQAMKRASEGREGKASSDIRCRFGASGRWEIKKMVK